VSRSPEASIIVPTFQEAGNLPALISRIAVALDNVNLSYEILVVDDNSQDGTSTVCSGLSERFPLRLITRRGQRGLATAVICGLNAARGKVLVVMDADLSHPPEAIPKLVQALQSPSVDFVIGSRYVEGGKVDDSWMWFRRINSLFATILARGLTSARDPMAGFFALNQSTFVQAGDLQPLGYKIGLELIVRCKCRRVAEVPISFQDRTCGQSKLTLRQQWLYLRHLGRLYVAKYQKRDTNCLDAM